MKIEYLADHPEFVPLLARWQHREWAFLHPGETLQIRISQLENQLGHREIPTTLAAIEDGATLGSASLVTRDLETRPDLSPWLAGVFVGEQYRRRGIGSALVKRIMLEAEALGIRTLYLFTTDQEQLYARLGWKTFGQQIYHEQHIVVMKINLSAKTKQHESRNVRQAGENPSN